MMTKWGIFSSSATAIAQRTKHIRIGTAVVVVPFNHRCARHPWNRRASGIRVEKCSTKVST